VRKEHEPQLRLPPKSVRTRGHDRFAVGQGTHASVAFSLKGFFKYCAKFNKTNVDKLKSDITFTFNENDKKWMSKIIQSNIYALGDSNVSERANSDLVVGRSNYTTGTYLSYVFGQLNTLKNMFILLNTNLMGSLTI
jgi:hypothetical protein